MRYKNVSVEDIPDTIRKILRSNAVDIASEAVEGRINKKIPKGLLLTGITGSGKTHCLYAIREVLKVYGKQEDVSEVENWVEVLFELKDKMGIHRLGDNIKEITDPQYCFIDDLGAENDTNWGQEMLYLVINKIYNKERTLFLSTNLTLPQLVEKYGERIMDRLSHICEIVEMPNKNYR